MQIRKNKIFAYLYSPKCLGCTTEIQEIASRERFSGCAVAFAGNAVMSFVSASRFGEYGAKLAFIARECPAH